MEATLRDEVQNPPRVTRGLNCHKSSSAASAGIVVGLHWLRGTVPHEAETKLREYLVLWFGDECDELPYGLWFYDRSVKWPNGVMLNYHSDRDRLPITNGRIAVEIPGSALDGYDTELIVSLLRGLRSLDFQASRLDVYADDHERTMTSPTWLYASVHEDDLFGGAIRRDYTGFRTCTRHVISGKDGRTYDEVAFGRRGQNGSGKYLRIYDKKLESKGEIDAIRMELELSNERARTAVDMILGSGPNVAQTLGSMVGGAIDFVHRDGKTHLDRMKRYDWWQSIIDRLGRARIAGKRVHKRVERSRDYVHRQVGGTLQMLHAAYGPEIMLPWLLDIVSDTDKMNASHYAALQDYARRHKHESGLNIAELRKFCDANGIQLESEGTDNEVSELRGGS